MTDQEKQINELLTQVDQALELAKQPGPGRAYALRAAKELLGAAIRLAKEQGE